MAGLNSVLSLSDDLARYLKACGKSSVLQTKPVNPSQLNGLKLANNTLEDTVIISHKSPLSEFTSYLQGVAWEGKSFKPTFENPNSPFAQYYASRQKGSIRISPTIGGFRSYLFNHAETLNVTKEEYYHLIDEIAKQTKAQTLASPGVKKALRQEFLDNADKIHKWGEIFATQHQFPDGTVKFSKFYDEKLYDQAVKEYIDFVEKLTGKKVLVGCKSRMNWAISGLGILNNPKAYKDVDYILIGHGKNSSLITDITHPNTWRFSDNDKSIYEFIEQNVPKGKKVMVTCCETQGVNKAIEAGVITQNEAVKLKESLPCLGNGVSGWFEATGGVKIYESGTRRIIGQINDNTIARSLTCSDIGATSGYADGQFTLNAITDPVITYL